MNTSLFWSKVMKSPGCWEWLGRLSDRGYGCFDTSAGRKSKKIFRAHRLAWVLVNGDIPSGMHVLHRCDNRACVNPAHLFLGTHDDNMRDMDAKGRRVSVAQHGQANGSHKITDHQASEIRGLAGTMTQRKISELYGLDQSTVSLIMSGKRRRYAEAAHAER